MKKHFLLVFVCMVMAVSAAMTGCSKSTTGPLVSSVTLSGNIYHDTSYVMPLPNLSITVYEIDTTAARTGAAVATTSTDTSGAFSVNVVNNKYYELEVTDGASIFHIYLPKTTASKSSIKLIFLSMIGASSIVTDGYLMMINNAGLIVSSDTITLDGGSNLNDSTVSPGIYNLVEMFYMGGGNSGWLIDIDVTQAAAPGKAHAVSYRGATRHVRVFPLSANNGSTAVFY